MYTLVLLANILYLDIINTGTDDLIISNIEASGLDFNTNFSSAIINPGESFEQPVYFFPVSTGEHEGLLSIYSNDPDESVVSVVLSGSAYIAPDIAVSMESISDTLNTGEIESQYFTISNNGGSDLEWEVDIGDLRGEYIPIPELEPYTITNFTRYSFLHLPSLM
mgnify:CR=1 FL=1